MEEVKNWLQTGSINLFGRPFAGKDTVGRELANALSGVMISGGDILRGKDMPKSVHEQIDNGKMAPTDEYLKIVLPYLSQETLKDKPLILSSVGRWHGEEPGVMAAASQSNHPLKAVIYIDIDEEEIRRRWKASHHLEDRGNRKDDAEHILDVRFEEFTNKTLPVLEFYREKGLLIEIDGMNNRKQVLQEIIEKLSVLAK